MPQMLSEMTFAERLRELKEESGMSERELAEKAGLPFDTVHTYIMGRSEPLLSNAIKLATALGVKLSAFAECVDAPVGRRPGVRRKK